MVYRVESFGKINEEDSTGTPIVNLAIYVISQVNDTGVRGVPLPKAQLAFIRYLVRYV